MQVLNERHNMLHRQAILLRAASEPLTQADRQRLDVRLTPPVKSAPIVSFQTTLLHRKRDDSSLKCVYSLLLTSRYVSYWYSEYTPSMEWWMSVHPDHPVITAAAIKSSIAVLNT